MSGATMRFQQDDHDDVDAFQLIRRKRPRPQTESNLMSFAKLSTEVTTSSSPNNNRPMMMALPAISQLLGGTARPMMETTASYFQRQRISEQGAYVERTMSPVTTIPLQQSHSLSGTIEAQPHDVDDPHEDDDEAEDKTPWPSALQYRDIFANMENGNIPVYDLGVDPRGVPLHPEFIYSEPVSCMYFLKCTRLLGKGSFGFPRKMKAQGTGVTNGATGKKSTKGKKDTSKDYEWRKMSFVTGLPKKQPVVRYITATCYSRATEVAAKKKVFRMHAVMLADGSGAEEAGDYVLVHIRAGGSKRIGLRASSADSVETQQIMQSVCLTPSTEYNANTNSGSPTKRPVSPPIAAVSTYSSQAASTSPHNKKRLHAEFISDQHASPFTKFMTSPVPTQAEPHAYASTNMMRSHPLFGKHSHGAGVNNARQLVRDMILQSCTSRDEMVQYVLGLQEELAALRQQAN